MAQYRSQQIGRSSISDILELLKGFSSGNERAQQKRSSFYDTAYAEYYNDIHVNSGTVEQVQDKLADINTFYKNNITNMSGTDIQKFEFLMEEGENQKQLIQSWDNTLNKLYDENDGISARYIQLLEKYQEAPRVEDQANIANQLNGLTLEYIKESERISREFGALIKLPHFDFQATQLDNLQAIFQNGTVLIKDEHLSPMDKNVLVNSFNQKSYAPVAAHIAKLSSIENQTVEGSWNAGINLSADINTKQKFLNNIDMVNDKFAYLKDTSIVLSDEERQNRDIEWENIKDLPAHTWPALDTTGEKIIEELTFKQILAGADPRINNLQKQYIYENEQAIQLYNQWDASYQNILGTSFKSLPSHALIPGYSVEKDDIQYDPADLNKDGIVDSLEQREYDIKMADKAKGLINIKDKTKDVTKNKEIAVKYGELYNKIVEEKAIFELELEDLETDKTSDYEEVDKMKEEIDKLVKTHGFIEPGEFEAHGIKTTLKSYEIENIYGGVEEYVKIANKIRELNNEYQKQKKALDKFKWGKGIYAKNQDEMRFLKKKISELEKKINKYKLKFESILKNQ